jgi:hypothetical protein
MISAQQQQMRQQSLKGLLGLDGGKINNPGGGDGFMLRGLSLNKNTPQQF